MEKEETVKLLGGIEVGAGPSGGCAKNKRRRTCMEIEGGGRQGGGRFTCPFSGLRSGEAHISLAVWRQKLKTCGFGPRQNEGGEEREDQGKSRPPPVPIHSESTLRPRIRGIFCSSKKERTGRKKKTRAGSREKGSRDREGENDEQGGEGKKAGKFFKGGKVKESMTNQVASSTGMY